MDTRNELRLEWLPPPPLERKRKVKHDPLVYVFGESPETTAIGSAPRDESSRNWHRGVAIYEI